MAIVVSPARNYTCVMPALPPKQKHIACYELYADKRNNLLLANSDIH
jgi:hypothetical protein